MGAVHHSFLKHRDSNLIGSIGPTIFLFEILDTAVFLSEPVQAQYFCSVLDDRDRTLAGHRI